MKKIASIKGMSCSHCSARVEKTLNKIDGVNAKVNLEENKAILDLSKDVSNKEIIDAIADIDYEVTKITEE